MIKCGEAALKHIIKNMFKISDKEKNLQAAREKDYVLE